METHHPMVDLVLTDQMADLAVDQALQTVEDLMVNDLQVYHNKEVLVVQVVVHKETEVDHCQMVLADHLKVAGCHHHQCL